MKLSDLDEEKTDVTANYEIAKRRFNASVADAVEKLLEDIKKPGGKDEARYAGR